MKEEWRVHNIKADYEAIGRALGICPMLARLLCNRKLHTYEEMFCYLHPEDGTQLHSPALLPDADQAVDLIQKAILSGKRLRIIGDYDVDGVTAIAILYRALSRLLLDKQLDWQVPHRVHDGYGLNQSLIAQAKADGVDLIITCDNGIAATEEIRQAKAMGMQVVVTDHHEVPQDGGAVSIADAVVDPKRADSVYPYKNICGAVVAWKLMCHLYDRIPGHTASELLPLLEFAAIATIADVMDLKDENRSITCQGLQRLRQTEFVGLAKLMEACRILPQTVGSFAIGFQMGPTLNAGGRLETAQEAVRLLLAEEETEAMQLAASLEELNSKRKNMTESAVAKAKELVIRTDLNKDRVLVVYLPDCHESIAGIVAGRLRELFYRPTFVLTNTKEGLKGSGRSIEGYDMFHELEKVGHLFTKYGGHELAAGLSLEEKNYPLFRKAINESCTLTQKQLTETVWIDLHIPPSQIDYTFAKELERMEPFGKGNETPTFATKSLHIKKLTLLGKERKGLRIQYQDECERRGEMTYWGDLEKFQTDLCTAYGEKAWEEVFTMPVEDIRMHAIYSVGIHAYRGEEYVQTRLKKYQFL